MSEYRLYYWKTRGRGEQIRLLLEELAQPYENVVVEKGPPFAALQAQGPSMLPFGSVPLLEEGTFRLAQGPVILSYLARKHGIAPVDPQLAATADAIALAAEDLRSQYFGLFGGDDPKQKQQQFVERRWRSRWLPNLSGLLELAGDTGYFVGGACTHADIAVWDAIDAVLLWVEGATLDGFSRVSAFHEAIKARPNVAAYLASGRHANG